MKILGEDRGEARCDTLFRLFGQSPKRHGSSEMLEKNNQRWIKADEGGRAVGKNVNDTGRVCKAYER
jgi:hypothetical protein